MLHAVFRIVQLANFTLKNMIVEWLNEWFSFHIESRRKIKTFLSTNFVPVDKNGFIKRDKLLKNFQKYDVASLKQYFACNNKLMSLPFGAAYRSLLMVYANWITETFITWGFEFLLFVEYNHSANMPKAWDFVGSLINEVIV